MNTLKEKIKILADKQFIRFAIAGVSNPLISYIVYLITLHILSGNYIIANIMGFILGTLNAYILNSRFVFKKNIVEGSGKKYFIKTFISYGVTCLLNTSLLYLIVEYAGVSVVIAPWINSVLIFMINFVLNKFWIYNDKIKNGEKK